MLAKFIPPNLKQVPIFGIAGNFAGHMEQANEVISSGIFPIYFPKAQNYLGVYPICHDQIMADFSQPIDIQMEAEVCLLFNVCYQKNQVNQLSPIAYTVFNDCSIRHKQTTRLSEKKNWGTCSAGIAQKWHPLKDFSPQGDFASLNLVSYLNRNHQIIDYGIDCPISNYQCFNEPLIKWITDALNHQPDLGALPELHHSLMALHQPKQIIVSLGATRYTKFGQTHFLQPNDQIGLFIYDTQLTTEPQVKQFFAQNLPAEQFQPGLGLIQTILTNPSQQAE